ncbi:hypothetical protein D0B54_03490 [Solimonas sp. K1W22B-7]|uniref:DUF7079 family protein n=1 Tax=Solimonas sp. K1W22B-7 TaxID=2303331 RepID=UPI000E332413|nr:hypothetical protein [Solimonas sp. K1W22B-7]AXQ27791.1 hypothetical protein D0B54_03490 [Solimonas sp. K1W22B-7]
MTPDLTPADLKQRKPVWEALSEFWLDTELQESDFDRIAGVMARSPYSLEEIRDIHRYEVAPAVSANLAGVAGEWAGFDSKWLVERCRAQALRRGSVLRRVLLWLRAPLLWYFTAGHWRKVLPRVRVLRAAVAARSPRGPRRIFVDALNLAYWRSNPPSLRLPLTLLAQLLAERHDVVLYFDASARYRLGGERELYERLLQHPRYCVEVPSGKSADGVMLRDAMACGGRVVSRDKYSDHRKRYRRLIDDPQRLLSGEVREGRVLVSKLNLDVPLPASSEAAWERLEPLLRRAIES